MSERKAEVCIVGGGIGGLAAAHELGKRGISSVILEASDRLGGRLKTVRSTDGAAWDVGAVGLLGSYKETVALIREIGLADKLSSSKVVLGVPRDGRMHPLDMGRPLSILGTDLLAGSSLWRARRLVGPLLKHWKKLNFGSMSGLAESDTETVSQFTLRELNAELHDYLIGPVIRSLWQRDPEDAPLVDLYWSLMAFAPTMFALHGGMDQLPRALAAGVNATLGAVVDEVEETAAGARVSYRVNGEARTETYRGCILAVPSDITARLLKPMPAELAAALAMLPYSCSVNVHFALDRAIGGRTQVVFPPEKEAPDLTTVVFEQNKGPGRAAAGRGSVSLFWRDSWSRPRMTADADAIIADALAQLKPIVPEFSESQVTQTHVERWSHAGVCRSVGGTRAIGTVERIAAGFGSIALAGDYYSLSGVNAALVSGQRAARKIAG